MKKLKKIALSLMSMAFLATSFVACSSDDSGNQVESVNENEHNSIKSTSSVDYARYAEDFYKKDFTEGRSVDIDSGEGDLIQIKELIIEGDARARGYVVKDLNNGEFLYFADVDRDNDVLTIFDSRENKTSSFNNLRSSADYLATDKFDFVTYSADYLTISAKKDCNFWKRLFGKCTETVERPVYGIGGEVEGCMTWVYETYYFLLSVVDTSANTSGVIHDCP